MDRPPRIDNLQYANWSEKIFRQLRDGGLDAIHVTIAYHENFRETVLNIEKWNRWFERFPELIFQGRFAIGRMQLVLHRLFFEDRLCCV